MSECIKLDQIKGNQILVWSEIENAFINATPSQTLLNIESVNHKPLSPNNNIIKSLSDNTLRTKGIVAGDNVIITDNGTDLIIDVSMERNRDAETLNGYTDEDFVKRENLNDLIDVGDIVASLDVYNKSQSHDMFMETNASNVPDVDNTYDLGANGRRYADIYANTLHGTATNASRAHTLHRNEAKENEVLTWKDGEWKPTPLGSINLSNLEDVSFEDVEDNDLIIFNADTNLWETVSLDSILPDSEMDFSSAGYGESVFINVIENTARFRTIVASDGILLSSDENSVYVQLDVDHVDNIVNDRLNITTINDLETVFDINQTQDNTMLVWEDGIIVNKPIPIGGSGDGSIDTSNAQTGDVLMFDGTNLVFSDVPSPLDDIDTSEAVDGHYLAFNGSGYELREIPSGDTFGDIDTSTATNGDVLVWDGTEFVVTSINTLNDVDLDGVENGYVLTYADGEFILTEATNVGLTLDDLDVSAADDGYYIAFNGSGYELRELPATEGGSGDANSDLLADVDTTMAVSGDVLMWDGVNYILDSVTTFEDIDVSSATNGNILTYRGGSFVLEESQEVVDSLSKVDTADASAGDVLMWNGSEYELSEIDDNDTLGDVVVDSAQDGYYVAYNGTGYELREITGSVSSNTDMLRDVSTSTATDGDILVWDGSEYVLKDVTTLSDVDTSGQTDGHVLIYRSGQFELSERTVSDTLADVVTVGASAGDVLMWNGSEYELSSIDDNDSLGDVSITGASDGDYIAFNGSGYELRELPASEGGGSTDNDTLGDVDTVGAKDGDYVAFNPISEEYELRELPVSSGGEGSDTLGDVDTGSAGAGDFLTWDGVKYTLSDVTTLSDIDTDLATDGQVLTYNGTDFILSDVSGDGSVDNDTLGDVDTASASDGDYVAFNGVDYELRTIPTNSGTDNDTLGDVDTDTASVGDLLSWNGSKYELTELTTLSDVDTDTATDGQVLTYNGTDFVLSDATSGDGTDNDTLGDVDTGSAEDGDYVAYNTSTSAYELRNIPVSTDTLGEVETSTASNGDVLTWDGIDYVLSTVTSSDGVTSITGLDDVDETVTPNDGEVLTYNESKSKYEPKPFSGGGSGGGTKYEIMKINYDVSNEFDNAEYLTDGIEVTEVIGVNTTELEITFTGYMFPPISVGYWGYRYDENVYFFINATGTINMMEADGGNVKGAPNLFDPERVDKSFTMRISADTNQTQASPSTDFPPQPTHAYVTFVMGE